MTNSTENPDEYSSYPQEEFLQVQRVEQVSNILSYKITVMYNKKKIQIIYINTNTFYT